MSDAITERADVESDVQNTYARGYHTYHIIIERSHRLRTVNDLSRSHNHNRMPSLGRRTLLLTLPRQNRG